MDSMILKPTLKSLLLNPPPLEVWSNLIKYGMGRLRPTTTLSYAPLSIVIYVSKRCNFKCSFCFTYNDLNKADWQDYELSPVGFQKLMDTDFGRKSLRIGFLGGEPFMNPHLFDFLKIANKMGKITTIVTNASLVDADKREKLKTISPTMLGISLYDNNVKEVVTLSEFEATHKKDFWVQSVVEATNLDAIKEKIKFAHKNRIKNLILSNFQPSYSKEIEKVIFNDNKDFYLISKESLILAKKLGITITLPNPIQRVYNKRSCSMTFDYIHVDAKGVMGPCCFRAPKAEFGNIFNPASWNNEAHQKIRETFVKPDIGPMSECMHCENYSRDLYNI